ncbi:hypothetical protein V2J09_014194 [Rumex salicifolius]
MFGATHRVTMSGDVFKDGGCPVATVSKPTSDVTKPPKPVMIAYPSVEAEEAAEFGVVMLLHGYMLSNSFYSHLIKHIASYGFIVVAPQVRIAGVLFSTFLAQPISIIWKVYSSIISLEINKKCTPKGVSHKEFYRECERPACYFVVKGYGHLDVLDDDTPGIKGLMSYFMCKKGASREPMRRFVAGVSVAFLKAYLDKDDSLLMAIKAGNAKFPVGFDNVHFRL